MLVIQFRIGLLEFVYLDVTQPRRATGRTLQVERAIVRFGGPCVAVALRAWTPGRGQRRALVPGRRQGGAEGGGECPGWETSQHAIMSS